MKNAISFLLGLLAAAGMECYQTFALGLITAAATAIVALVCGLSLWSALPVVAAAALLFVHLVARTRGAKLSRAEATAFAVGTLAAWLLLAAGHLVK